MDMEMWSTRTQKHGQHGHGNVVNMDTNEAVNGDKGDAFNANSSNVVDPDDVDVNGQCADTGCG